MDIAKAMQFAVVRGVGFGLVGGYLLATFQPSNTPTILKDHPYIFSVIVTLGVLLVDNLYIYPKFRSPLRHLPTIKGVRVPPSERTQVRFKLASLSFFFFFWCVLYTRHLPY